MRVDPGGRASTSSHFKPSSILATTRAPTMSIFELRLPNGLPTPPEKALYLVLGREEAGELYRWDTYVARPRTRKF